LVPTGKKRKMFDFLYTGDTEKSTINVDFPHTFGLGKITNNEGRRPELFEGMSNNASNQIKNTFEDLARKAREAAEAAARRAQEEAERARQWFLQQQREAERRIMEEAAAARRAIEAAFQAKTNRKRDSINSAKDYNIYFVQTVAGSHQKMLGSTSISPGANNVVSFMIDFRGINGGNPQTNQWNQIIGLTTDANGGDQRYLGIWICPGANTLHIRTETEANGNDNISDCNHPLSIGQHRIDIIGITNGDFSQTYWVYDNGNLFANPTISGKTEDGLKNRIYVFSSYSNFKHVSELGHKVSPLIIMTGNGNQYNQQLIMNGLNAFYDQLNYFRNM